MSHYEISQSKKHRRDSPDTYSLITSVKKRQSRWGTESTACKLTGLQTAITVPMTSEQIEAYVLHVRIEEITQKLKIDDVIPANRNQRCPSPPPEYNSSGVRVNTSYHRHRELLEKERSTLIHIALRTIPNYCPPHGYAQTRILFKEKVYIPVQDFPDIRFIGQLLGPRGSSLADMNARSGAKIVIRGKGSVKGGRDNGGSHRPENGESQEPLHCLISADTQKKVDKAKTLVQTVIETAITIPEHENDRKREQLRSLAVMNGTFRDDEARGSSDRRGTVVQAMNIVCRVCGNGAHIARDCPDRAAPGAGAAQQAVIPPWRQGNQSPASHDALDLEVLRFESEMKTEFLSR